MTSMEARPGSVSPGVPLGRERADRLRPVSPALEPARRLSAAPCDSGGGALRLHEAAHWHHVRIEEVPVEEFCPLDLKMGDRQQLSQFQGARDVLAEDTACLLAATMAGMMRDPC